MNVWYCFGIFSSLWIWIFSLWSFCSVVMGTLLLICLCFFITFGAADAAIAALLCSVFYLSIRLPYFWMDAQKNGIYGTDKAKGWTCYCSFWRPIICAWRFECCMYDDEGWDALRGVCFYYYFYGWFLFPCWPGTLLLLFSLIFLPPSCLFQMVLLLLIARIFLHLLCKIFSFSPGLV